MSQRMNNNNKRKLPMSSLAVDIGCSCRKSSKLFNFLHPKPKPSSSSASSSASAASSSSALHRHAAASSSENSSTSYLSLRYLLDAESSLKAPHKPVKGFGRIDGEGIAVEKDSDDPYLDFRHSMLQMILENGIYSKNDMRELLNCFLQLNSPYYHGIIVRAFTDIWNGVFSVKSPAASSVVDQHYPSMSSSPTESNAYNPYGYNYYKSPWEY